MANDAGRAGVLEELLKEAGIPVSGISVTDINANPVDFTIQYSPSATSEQIGLGDQIGAAFDWRKRRALNRNTVVTALQQLTTAQQNSILRHVICELVRNDAGLATKINAALATSLTVDEVDPT